MSTCHFDVASTPFNWCFDVAAQYFEEILLNLIINRVGKKNKANIIQRDLSLCTQWRLFEATSGYLTAWLEKFLIHENWWNAIPEKCKIFSSLKATILHMCMWSPASLHSVWLLSSWLLPEEQASIGIHTNAELHFLNLFPLVVWLHRVKWQRMLQHLEKGSLGQ